MRILTYRPANSWLHRKLDSSWWRWVVTSLAYGGALAALLIAAAAPRQERLRLAYETARLEEEVAALERELQALELAESQLKAPSTLAQQLPEMGLAAPDPSRVFYLTEDGQLLRPTPTPSGRKP